MKTKFLFLAPLLLVTACSSSPMRDPVHNPQGLNNDDLIKTQIAKLEAMQRDMERREQELKYQHLRELNQMQMQVKTRSSECRFLCF